MTAEPDRPPFITIGENVHTTRIVRRGAAHVGTDDRGREAITFTDEHGETHRLPISEAERRTQEYEEGRIKHVRTAVRMAMEEGEDAEVAVAYLRALAIDQVRAGSAYLDVNVDEVSLKLPEQVAAMRWLVELIGPAVDVPLSIDSSNAEIIEAGMAAAPTHAGPPMLNSASLERVEALDIAVAAGGPVIVTAAGEAGMPSDSEGRVANATRMVEAALAKGISLNRLYVDPLVFPISVDGAFGDHCLDAIRTIRERYGPDIHITGGMSNVSFGLPNRRLINDAFLLLAIEAGADSGIIDPLMNPPSRALEADRAARPFELALNVLSGADRHCKAYMKAFRKGELEPV
jgi:5-methyltetrahydrofolate--homocysteine methyltransferase